MIDTDRYEGHSKGPWYWDGNLCNDEYSDKHGTEQWTVLDWELGVGDADKQLIADAPLLLQEIKRLREALITVQQSLFWDEEDRAMDGDPITLEALFAQVEQVRSDITEMIK
tara:strand:- start:450 stop:785 length:336 start_codon:yes stop_codon:yes gene_type:complete